MLYDKRAIKISAWPFRRKIGGTVVEPGEDLALSPQQVAQAWYGG